jgi:hypothetical protein
LIYIIELSHLQVSEKKSTRGSKQKINVTPHPIPNWPAKHVFLNVLRCLPILKNGEFLTLSYAFPLPQKWLSEGLSFCLVFHIEVKLKISSSI